MVGLDVLDGLLQHKQFYDSMILCFALPEDHKITPVYGDCLFVIFGRVTLSEHHHFVERELMEETQSSSPGTSVL